MPARHSPAIQEGRPTAASGTRAGDRLPDARVGRDGQRCWLGGALATLGFQLLLCGRPDGWDAGQAAAVRRRYREAWPYTT